MTANDIVRKLGPALALLAILAGLLVWQHAGPAAPPVTQLAAGPSAIAAAGASVTNEPLRAAFNRDADKVRLLLLIDPT
jgi:hypothetical protein